MTSAGRGGGAPVPPRTGLLSWVAGDQAETRRFFKKCSHTRPLSGGVAEVPPAGPTIESASRDRQARRNLREVYNTTDPERCSAALAAKQRMAAVGPDKPPLTSANATADNQTYVNPQSQEVAFDAITGVRSQ